MARRLMTQTKARRVVITGLGAIAPNGIGKDAFWRGLVSGVPAIRRISTFDTSKNECRIAAEVDFSPSAFFSVKRTRELWRFSQFAVSAALLATQDARLTIERALADRVAVCFGTSVNGMGDAEQVHEQFLERGPSRQLIPIVVGCPPHTATSQIAIELGTTGPAVTVSSNCCTGLDAIQAGWSQIASGRVDVAIAGGAEAPLFPFTFSSFEALGLLSKRNDDPRAASRPYDALRDGLVLGEGGGAVVLEELSFARDRGAEIYAEVAGFATAGEGADMRKSDATGSALASAIGRALTSAQMTPDDIDYINAHGSSLPDYDVCDTNAFKKVFGRGAYNVPLSSIKSMLGQAVSASGAFQAISSCLSIRDGILPPTANQEVRDPQCDLDCVPNKARSSRVRNVLMNAHGIGGGFSVLILKSPPQRM
jgi:3-oxoacyl-[acyl-carrier-protein] synthase II